MNRGLEDQLYFTKMKRILTALLIVSSSAFWAGAEFIAAEADSAAAANGNGGFAGEAKNMNLGLHHISLGFLGYYKSTSGDFEFLDFDASVATPNFLNYRYSLSKNIDFAIDMHVWGNEINYYGAKVTTTAGGLGIGTRFTQNDLSRFIYPYIQGNVYIMVEGISVEYGGHTNEASESGVGFGLNTGIEFKVGRHVSVPVEVLYLYGKPADDISGYGLCAGLSFNWGKMPAGEDATRYYSPPAAMQTATTEDKAAIDAPATLSAAPETAAETGQIVPSEQEMEKSEAVPLAPNIAEPAAEPEAPKKKGPACHHISAGALGYYRAQSDDFKRLGKDAGEGQSFFLDYRHTFSRKFDFVLDLRGWTSEFRWQGYDFMMTVEGLGTGIRYRFAGPEARLQPYLQASILSIGEHLTTVFSSTEETKVYRRDYGFCLNGGLDIRLSKSVNVPLDLMLFYGRPAENITGLGIVTGIGFNF